MASYLALQLWTVTFLLGAHCQTLPKELNLESKVPHVNPSISEVPCPDPQDISPCTCISYTYRSPVIDCSAVGSEDELRSIFQKPFSPKDFYQFKMYSCSDITVLSEGIFGDATFESIFIYGGGFKTVEPKTFIGSASTLRSILISNVWLTSFPFDELPQYEQLMALNLRDNSIPSFPNLKSSTLTSLNLDFNPVSILPKEAFANVPNLVSFDCRWCGITEIQSGTFTGLANLKSVTIDSNGIKYLPENTVEFSTDLPSFSISDNLLTNVSVGAIKVKGNPTYFEVDITNNEITVLEEEVWTPVMEKMYGGVSFSAYNNPLSCECDIAWLILNPDFMDNLFGYESCANQTRLRELDPAYYEEMC